jgi:hypothetical protein
LSSNDISGKNDYNFLGKDNKEKFNEYIEETETSTKKVDAFNNINQNINNEEEIIEKNNIPVVNDDNLKNSEISIRIPIYCQNYIILTTINIPTKDVKYIKDALYGWCLIVVGDKKTPLDWKYKDTYYLNVNDQMILAKKYNLINKIPYNSYIRKLVGYLFAIDNGAKYIYETDDDNSPLDGLFGFRYENFKGLELDLDNKCNNDTLFVNPYSYFGQPSVWPRGYPLEKITDTSSYRPINSESKNCISKLYKIYNNKQVPLIQQGLVNGDPDVDAIYRLTRKNENLLNIKFDVNSPPFVLSNKHQYAPLNSQNTFYHYDSFFTLIFPLNVTFRECDILRGYISIRLLQEINGRVAFMPPNALQIRNSHSFHKDYLEEKRLYESIYKFVDDLDKWTCEKDTLKECVIDCIQMLINNKHFESSELEFYKTWLNDLDSIGYRWPKLKRNNQQPSQNNNLLSIYHKSIEQEHSSISNQKELVLNTLNITSLQMNYLDKVCQTDIDFKKFKPCVLDNIILVTTASSIDDLKQIYFLINVHFPYIIVCYENKTDESLKKFILLNNTPSITILFSSRENFKSCINRSFKIGFKQQSFLIAKDFTKLNFWSDKTVLAIPDDKNIINFNSLEQENSNETENKLEKNFYFIRRNVANGVMQYISKTKENSMSLCNYYQKKQENILCKNILNEINKPTWHSNDLPSEFCESLEMRKIWLPDYYDEYDAPEYKHGIYTDIQTTLVNLGQYVILAGFNDMMIFEKEAFKLAPRIDIPYDPYFTESDVKQLFESYKTRDEFTQCDFVLCSFPSSLCEKYIPLNKTIIFNPVDKYNLARCTKNTWEKLNNNYNMLKSKSKLILSSMNKYNGEYQAYFTGWYGYRLFSYGGFYTRGIEYNPIKEEILVGPISLGTKGADILNDLKTNALQLGVEFSHILEIYPKYDLADLVNHSAVVLFPYSVNDYLFTDLYAVQIPIFVPSVNLLITWKNLDQVFDETTKENFFCSNSSDINPSRNTQHKYSPNEKSDISYKYWMNFSEYYQMPFVTVFNSWSDLILKLKTTDLKQISENMKNFNKIREADLLDNWCRIIKSKSEKATVPKSYEEALKYFNTDTFTVSKRKPN